MINNTENNKDNNNNNNKLSLAKVISQIYLKNKFT